LRAFVAVAKLKSFTQAATALHMPQPTLTVADAWNRFERP
jgi:DNA-binding transcriptional LysR family regulator